MYSSVDTNDQLEDEQYSVNDPLIYRHVDINQPESFFQKMLRFWKELF